MVNFCHCTQLLGCDVVCSSYRSRHHCLLYPAILHHTPHHLLHASCHRRILLALRNSALIWPAVLCELIANCRAKTSKETICSSLTFIMENLLYAQTPIFKGPLHTFCDNGCPFQLQTFRTYMANQRQKYLKRDRFIQHIFKCTI